MPTKAQRHDAIRERAREAVRSLYHNATPTYPRLDPPAAEHFESWFEDAARFEIEYLNDGGAYGRDYQKTLRATCNAGRYKSETARDYYVRKCMRAMREERARCNNLDSRVSPTNAMWERITEFGRLYQYGRGGRSLAPDHLYSDRNWNAGPKEDFPNDLNMLDCVELIQIVESFNAYVESWCRSVPEMWREHWAEIEAERAAEREAAETRAARCLERSRPDMYGRAASA